MTNFEVIPGLNQYCGPALLSIMTGKSTDECAAVISAVSGRTVIRSVQLNHLLEALRRLRCKVEERPVVAKTLFGNLQAYSNFDGYYMIRVPHHIVAIQVLSGKILFCDNHTKSPIPAEASARLLQEVSNIYQVIPRNPPKLLQRDIRVRINGNTIIFEADCKYLDPEDDSVTTIGYIHIKDDSDLDKIRLALPYTLDSTLNSTLDNR